MLAYLAEKRHPVAEQALRQFVTALEESLLAEPPDGGSGDRNQWLGHLDETCAALARHATPGSWRTLVDHGLRTEPQLGHPAARLAELGGHNLGVQPELVSRLVAAAVADIRRRLLARPTAAQAERLGHVVAALADTRTTEVQELLETLAGRFPDEDVGWRAARVLANAGTGGGFDASVGPTLSGDLRVLGLPTLLQSLADSRVSGVLRLVDLRGRSVATMEFERGLLATARYGSLEGGPLRGRIEKGREGPEGLDSAPARGATAPRPVATRLRDRPRRRAPRAHRPASPGGHRRGRHRPRDLALGEGRRGHDAPGVRAADAHRVRRCLVDWVEDGALQLGAGGTEENGTERSGRTETD